MQKNIENYLLLFSEMLMPMLYVGTISFNLHIKYRYLKHVVTIQTGKLGINFEYNKVKIVLTFSFSISFE